MSLSISSSASSFASSTSYGDTGSIAQNGGFDPTNQIGQARQNQNESAPASAATPATGTAAVAQAGAVGGSNISARGVDPNAGAEESGDSPPPPPPQASGRGQFVDLNV
jgi:hypothetical protein